MQFRPIKTKRNSFLSFMSFMCLFLVWSCNEEKSASEDPPFGTGALSFNVEYIDGTDANLRSATAKIDCDGQGIATVEAKVYNSENTREIAYGGPWNCDAGSGTILDVPTGRDRTIVVLGKDANGDIIFSGQKSGFAVFANSDNDAGIIKCYAFVPNLTAPANDAVVKQGAVDLRWEAVAGATEYCVFVSQNSDLSDPVIEDHPASANSAPSQLAPITTYYWQVFAIDSNGNWGIGSQIRSLTVSGRLPDTGQNSNHTDTFGEDSDYDINPPTFIKLETSGNVLPDDADDWAMVRDDITGLIWEVKTDHDNIHNVDATYTWQDAQDIFIAQLNNDNFGGYSDWRLPTIKELYTLANKGRYNSAVNGDYFPIIKYSNTTPHLVYWSSTAYVPDSGIAWFLNFQNGNISFSETGDLNNANYVIAVRGKQVNSTFVDNGNGTVTDIATGLMWQKVDATNQDGSAKIIAWEEALNYCEALELAGKDDWRLPNINELQSIVDYHLHSPAVDKDFFPNIKSYYYWSSTSYEPNNNIAWDINFISGSIWNSDKTDDRHVRAVRGGE